MGEMLGLVFVYTIYTDNAPRVNDRIDVLSCNALTRTQHVTVRINHSSVTRIARLFTENTDSALHTPLDNNNKNH